MSIGCGTLGGPKGFRTGNLRASSTNGKQHTLPKHPAHQPFDKLAITSHWGAEQNKGPTRLWGTVSQTKLGGEERPDASPEHWLKGDYWNVDSNIRIWGEHEVKRNAASASLDVHRHDQIMRVTLPPLQGQESKLAGRQCISGVVGADCCFLEAWGFSLGQRDRQARPTRLWKPVTSDEFFRSERSFDRNLGRMTDNFRTLRRSRTEPGKIMPDGATMLKPEDVGGESGELAEPEDHQLEQMGRTYGSRSCRFWDRYDHVSRREAAKMACSVHSPSCQSHGSHPYKEGELSPASVYTLKFRKNGEDALRKYEKPNERSIASTLRSSGGAKARNVKTIRLNNTGNRAASISA